MEHTPRDPRAGRRPAAEPDTRPQDTLVWGKNPVTELLKSGRPADTVYLADSLPASAAGYYTALAKQAGAVVKKVPAHKLQKLCGGAEHQGAAARIPVARVPNLAQAVRELKEQNIFVYCADMGGAPLERTDLTGAVAVVMGSEGSGPSALVKKLCDGVVSLDMAARDTGVDSYNVSVAAGILLYDIMRRRAAGSH